MRTIPRLLLFSAAVLALPRVGAVGCVDFEGRGVPNVVYTGGEVTEVDGRRFRIGEAQFELPKSVRALRWCGRRRDVDVDQLSVGLKIGVVGMLRPDGTVLAYWADGGDYETIVTVPGRDVAGGVVASTQGGTQFEGIRLAESFVVGGITYRIDSETVDSTILDFAAGHYIDAGARDAADAPVPLDLIVPGDAVVIAYTKDESGNRTARNVTVRTAGFARRISGTVTAAWVDANNVRGFEVDGVPAILDEGTIAYREPRIPVDGGWDRVEVGQTVRIHGPLRNGRVFCDGLLVVNKAHTQPAREAARRPGHLVVDGIVESVETDGSLSVCGLNVKRRSHRALHVGDRVRVTARLRHGAIVAARVRRR